MREGKISRTVWNRYIRKQLHREREEVLGTPSWTEDCSAISGERADTFMWTEASASGTGGQIGYYAAMKAAGDLAAHGARPAGVSVNFLLPPDIPEELTGELTAGIEEACANADMQISRVTGEVSRAVACPIVSVTAAGFMETKAASAVSPGVRNDALAVKGSAAAAQSVCHSAQMRENRIRPGQEILLCGYAGLEGTLRVLDEARKELSERFVPAFLRKAADLKQDIVPPGILLEACAEAGWNHISAIRQIGSGGIFGALWEMAEAADVGLDLDLRAISLKQETVEICEFFRINPYLLTSAGSFLIATDHAGRVIEVLEKAGARAGRLGVATAQKARVITSGEEIRYMDRPAADELLRWQDERITGGREN